MNPNPFPAVLIGGPPHSGKSVLVHSLTEALRARQIDHYVLRATPDGEGDWSNVADQELVQALRQKGKFTPSFVSSTMSYLQERHIPLLVDVGGRPTDDQQALFGLCTHAILLVGERVEEPGRFEREMVEWQEMMEQQHVPVVAALRSVLAGTEEVETAEPTITGTIAGLERGHVASGMLVDLLVERLAKILTGSGVDVVGQHEAAAPEGLFVHLPHVLQSLRPGATTWLPADLPGLAALVPAGETLAVYGRGPNWVYTLLALHAGDAPVWFFNIRGGWLPLPQLPVVPDLLAHQPGMQQGWSVTEQAEEGYTLLTFSRAGQHLDPRRPEQLPLPQPQFRPGLVLSGQMPHWVMAAAARRLGSGQDLPVEWVGVFQPHLGGAAVVYSNSEAYPVGFVLPMSL